MLFHFLERLGLQIFKHREKYEFTCKYNKRWIIKALKTTATLMKVVLPVYAIVVLLKYSPVMPLLEQLFQSSMGIFNLPGGSSSFDRRSLYR